MSLAIHSTKLPQDLTLESIDVLVAFYREQLLSELRRNTPINISLFNHNLKCNIDYINKKLAFKWVHYHKRIKAAIIEFFRTWNYDLIEVGSSFTGTQIKYNMDYDFVAVNRFHNHWSNSDVGALVNSEKDKLAVVLQCLQPELNIPGVHISKVNINKWDRVNTVTIYFGNDYTPYTSTFSFDIIPGVYSEQEKNVYTPNKTMESWVAQDKQFVKDLLFNAGMVDLIKCLKWYNIMKLNKAVSGCWFEFAVCKLIEEDALMIYDKDRDDSFGNYHYCFSYNFSVVLQYFVRVFNGNTVLKHMFEDYDLVSTLNDTIVHRDTIAKTLSNIKSQLNYALTIETIPEAMYTAIFLL